MRREGAACAALRVALRVLGIINEAEICTREKTEVLINWQSRESTADIFNIRANNGE